MVFISFLLILCPGILVWKLCGQETENSLKTLLTILLDDLLILTGVYLVLYMVYGRIPVSFDSRYYETISTSIFQVSFIWKYGLMSCGAGFGLAFVKGLLRRCFQKWEMRNR